MISSNCFPNSMIGLCITKRHLGRDLDTISRGLRDKIPVNISEGKLRPEEPLQAAKLASEAGLALRDHIPILPRWKDYEDENNNDLLEDYKGKIAVSTQSVLLYAIEKFHQRKPVSLSKVGLF